MQLDSRRGLSTTVSRLSRQPTSPANGAVFGLITAAEAQLVVRALMSDLDPGPGAPDSPWAAVVARPDGSYAATASTMLPGGLFWVVADGQFVVGTDPLAVDHQLPGR